MDSARSVGNFDVHHTVPLASDARPPTRKTCRIAKVLPQGVNKLQQSFVAIVCDNSSINSRVCTHHIRVKNNMFFAWNERLGNVIRHSIQSYIKCLANSIILGLASRVPRAHSVKLSL